MHIPDGFLGPKTCVACFLAAAPFWVVAWRRLRRRLEMSFEVPYVAVASAFVFILMMFNVPIPGGTSGHAVGTAIVAIALGVGPAILAVSFALVVQALLFQDGGVTAFGANALTMAMVQAVVAAGVWRIAGPRPGGKNPQRALWAGFAAGYLAALSSAAVTGVVLGLQPVLERAADGTPAYFPIGLHVTLPAMVLSHLLVGVLEGAVTGLAVSYLARAPRLLETVPAMEAPRPESPGLVTAVGALVRRRVFWAVAGVAILAVPLGLWLPAAVQATEPWGEWGPEETAAKAGLAQVPSGMARLSDFWRAPVPDYTLGAEAGTALESFQYVASGVTGVAVLTLLFLGVGWWQKRQALRSR